MRIHMPNIGPVRVLSAPELLTTMREEHAAQAYRRLLQQLSPEKVRLWTASSERLQLPEQLLVGILFGYNLLATARVIKTADPAIVMMHDVVVDKGCRGKGLGRLAVTHLEVMVRQQWCQTDSRLLRLTSHPSRNTARFYLELGYEQIGTADSGSDLYEKFLSRGLPQ